MGSAASQSTTKFHKNTTSDEIMTEFGSHANGKYAIVTGSNCGLGFETARSLAKYGATVTIACRSKKNGDEAVAAILSEIPTAKVSFLQLDLGSFDSIHTFVREYKASKKPIHFLINNAGIVACNRTFTTNGLESQFGVNHIGHFLLTTELLDVLNASGTPEAPARVVNVASSATWLFAPKNVGIHFDDLRGDKSYHPWERYGSAKIANVWFTNELDRRMKAEGANVLSVSLHPGAIASTNLGRNLDFSLAMSVFPILWLRKGGLYEVLWATPYKSIKAGSSTTLLCALDPAIVRGAYYADCQVETTFVHELLHDEAKEKQLWAVSEQIVRQQQ